MENTLKIPGSFNIPQAREWIQNIKPQSEKKLVKKINIPTHTLGKLLTIFLVVLTSIAIVWVLSMKDILIEYLCIAVFLIAIKIFTLSKHERTQPKFPAEKFDLQKINQDEKLGHLYKQYLGVSAKLPRI